jgi:hypothetical protein
MDEVKATEGHQIETSDELCTGDAISRRQRFAEVVLLVLLFFAYAGDPPPMVNEAHYLVKAKNFWQPEWCSNDLLVASGKAHTTYYALFGWPTLFVSFETTAWVGRIVGWSLLAFGLQRLSWNLLRRRYVCLGVAAVWIAGVEYGNLAGEWVVGGIEAKVPAYALILLALSEMICRRWARVWILMGAASAFHVLSGGWAVIAAAITWWFTERGREDGQRLFTLPLFLGGAIALFGLLPAIGLTLGASPQDSTIAARIYSYYRIKHHLLPADFHFEWFLRHGVLILATVLAASLYWRRSDRVRQLGYFTLGAIWIAVGGLIAGLLPQIAPDLAAKLLRFYWFRLTDAIVPLMFALLVGRMLCDDRRRLLVIGITLTLLAVSLDLKSTYRRSRLRVPPSVSNDLLGKDVGADPKVQQQVFRDWLAVCRWARASSGPDEVFLTPRHQQTFKWYAERAEVVNWKDVPQDAASLIEWYGRFQEVFPRRLGHVRVTIQYAKLREYREKYGAQFMIVDRRVAGDNLPLIRLYPMAPETNATYAVYELPR